MRYWGFASPQLNLPRHEMHQGTSPHVARPHLWSRSRIFRELRQLQQFCPNFQVMPPPTYQTLSEVDVCVPN